MILLMYKRPIDEVKIIKVKDNEKVPSLCLLNTFRERKEFKTVSRATRMGLAAKNSQPSYPVNDFAHVAEVSTRCPRDEVKIIKAKDNEQVPTLRLLP